MPALPLSLRPEPARPVMSEPDPLPKLTNARRGLVVVIGRSGHGPTAHVAPKHVDKSGSSSMLSVRSKSPQPE